MARQRKSSGSNEIVFNLAPLGSSEKQKQFFAAKTRYVGYGGAKGGGKSWSVRTKGIAGSQVYPGIRILMMRQHYNELEENLILPILKEVPPELASYNSTSHLLEFTNSSTIKFGHWQGELSEQEYNGIEYDWIFIDEATQFSEDAFRFLGGCLRGVNDIPKRMYITCNPGGVGHQWVKRLFIDRDYHTNEPDPEMNENPDDYTFIFATVEDNQILLNSPGGRGYMAWLSQMPEKKRRAYRYGDWNAMSGQYFDEFSDALHVHSAFEIPQNWMRYRAFDYGLDMFACYWFAVDEDGRSWCYRECGGPNLIVQQAAEMIHQRTPIGERIQTTYIPPDMWSRQKDSGKTMAEMFMANGISVTKSDNSRVQGHMAIKDMLAIAPLHDPYVKKIYGDKIPETLPMLMFFPTCKKLISHLQAIQADDKNPDDCAKEPHEVTHEVDALRYFAVMRTLSADAAKEAQNDDDFETGEDYEDFMCGGEATSAYIGYGGENVS